MVHAEKKTVVMLLFYIVYVTAPNKIPPDSQDVATINEGMTGTFHY